MKKNWKKLVCLMVAFCMLLASSGAVYAEGEATTLPKQQSVEIKAYRETAPASTETVYSIQINWMDMVFKYKEAYEGKWDPSKLEYTGGWESEWIPNSDTSNLIDIYNMSEVPIKASFQFQDDFAEVNLGYEFIHGKSMENPLEVLDYNNNRYEVVLPVGTPGNAPMHQVGLDIVSGDLPSGYTNSTADTAHKIGSVTIVVEDASAGS